MGNDSVEATERLRGVKEMANFRANYPVYRFGQYFSLLSILMRLLTSD